MKLSSFLLLSILAIPSLGAQTKPAWRSATTEELKAVLPARAPVQKERIETEMRTASGIINSNGKVIAGVVLITAGYSADGKYSHYLLVQSPITIGDISFAPGSYVFGWQRTDDGLVVKFYDADYGDRPRHRYGASDGPGDQGGVVSYVAPGGSIDSSDRTI